VVIPLTIFYMGLGAVVFLYDFGNPNGEMVKIYSRAELREPAVNLRWQSPDCSRRS